MKSMLTGIRLLHNHFTSGMFAPSVTQTFQQIQQEY